MSFWPYSMFVTEEEAWQHALEEAAEHTSSKVYDNTGNGVTVEWRD